VSVPRRLGLDLLIGRTEHIPMKESDSERDINDEDPSHWAFLSPCANTFHSRLHNEGENHSHAGPKNKKIKK